MSRVYGVIAILVIGSSIMEIDSTKCELRFVSVVFRHGDRAPDDNGKELYPNDPHLNNHFLPMGLGGLTNAGKRREYSLGQILRKRYGNFLGKLYIPEDIVARSTDYQRTKMSLSLVLGSLYQPGQSQRWNPELNWQPIPMSYLPDALDVLLVPEECPRYLEELERVKALAEVVKRVEEFRPLMNNLTALTGKLINNTNDMYYLYHGLMAEFSMGLKLPVWTNSMIPNGSLFDGTVLEYEIVSYNELLKRLNGGTLLKRIIDDTVATVKNGTKKARKMNLFSGHETNIAALLQTLGVYQPHVPEYSSAIFVELVRQDDYHYVQVQHYLGIPAAVTTLTIPDCKELCPLDDFIRLLKNVTPTNEELACPKSVRD